MVDVAMLYCLQIAEALFTLQNQRRHSQTMTPCCLTPKSARIPEIQSSGCTYVSPMDSMHMLRPQRNYQGHSHQAVSIYLSANDLAVHDCKTLLSIAFQGRHLPRACPCRSTPEPARTPGSETWACCLETRLQRPAASWHCTASVGCVLPAIQTHIPVMSYQ